MIKGLGNDIVEISRIRQSIERHGDHFLSNLFTPQEIAYCKQFKDPVPHFAGRFAAKEAIAKALGCGFGPDLSWHDLEILNDEKGRPVVRFKNHHILVSISHGTDYATAVAILST
jgi:holo-[acyl-carrier protein] synthase